MPSTLPVIKVRTSIENVAKLKTIAKYNKRSVSKEVEALIDEHIEKFEKEVGRIDVGVMNPKEMLEALGDKIKGYPPYGDNTKEK